MIKKKKKEEACGEFELMLKKMYFYLSEFLPNENAYFLPPLSKDNISNLVILPFIAEF